LAEINKIKLPAAIRASNETSNSAEPPHKKRV